MDSPRHIARHSSFAHAGHDIYRFTGTAKAGLSEGCLYMGNLAIMASIAAIRATLSIGSYVPMASLAAVDAAA